MSLLNYKMSLYHELKTVILPMFGYIDDVTNEQLIPVEGMGDMYQFSHREIVYTDPSGHINPSGVKIYDDSRQLDLTEFQVDYLHGLVTISTPPSGAMTASYQYFPVKVIDAFPTAEEFATYDLPVVAIDLDSQVPSDYAIGQNQSFWTMNYFIDIFASSDAMRLQMMDRIQRGLKKWIPLLNFEEEMPLQYDGTINPKFDWENQFIQWLKLRGNPRGTLVNLGDVSPKERFRANIYGAIKNIH